MPETCFDALKLLRHKRTGEWLPTKNVARNTKLVYYCDELIALRFHKTDIAHYTPNGVRIDTRENRSDRSPYGEGWFTITTWARIDEFTPANTYTQRGIRYVNGRLYFPGMFITPDGQVESKIEPELEAAIERVLRTYPQRLRRHAQRVAETWREWGQVPSCCERPWDSEDGHAHYLGHVEANEYVVPKIADEIAQNLRVRDYQGERLVQSLAKSLRNSFKPLVRVAVKRTCPEFPYPQLTKRNR